MSNFLGSLASEFSEFNFTEYNITNEIEENATEHNTSYFLNHNSDYEGSFFYFDYDLAQIPYPKEKKNGAFCGGFDKNCGMYGH